jgi:hypothetical protein
VSPAAVGLLSAALVGLLSGGTTWLSIRANGRERRKDQQATWDRDDQVAAKAAEAARLLLAAQQESIARTDAVADHVAASTSVTTAKLEVIHTLVNSTLTAALLAALDASRSELVTLLKMADMQRAHGDDPSEDELASITVLRRKVGELSAAMQEREAQTRAADTQIATEAARQADRS